MLSQKKENILRHIIKHRDILIFVFVVVGFHAFWKIGRDADATGHIIHFYGINLSSFFSSLCDHWTNLVYRFVSLFKGDELEKYFCLLYYSDTNTGINIIWGCAGIKEIFMTALVIMTAQGNYRKKMWYIPMGILFILLLNYIRLSTLTFLVHHHMNLFDFVHKIVFRFVMYGGIFLIWLVWIEKIGKKLTKDNDN